MAPLIKTALKRKEGEMKKIVLYFILFSFCLAGDLCLMFWNMENLFDTRDDPGKQDGDFMPGGAKRFTHRAYALKSRHMAEVINHVGPDLLAMVEVENREVLEDLALQLHHYRDWEIRIDEGSDIRGIDPALMFRRDKFTLIRCSYYPVFIAARGYHSRPLMRADLAVADTKDTLTLFINHWPSRRGGKALTDPYRLYAASILHGAVREVREEHPGYAILMTGDFNDDAVDTCLRYMMRDPEIHYLEAKRPRHIYGTYYYEGEWVQFDHFLSAAFDSGGLDVKETRLIAPFWIREMPGRGPLRFYKGMEISGGYSDHYPICVKLGFKRKNIE